MSMGRPWQKVFWKGLEDADFRRLSAEAAGVLFVLRMMASRSFDGHGYADGKLRDEAGAPLDVKGAKKAVVGVLGGVSKAGAKRVAAAVEGAFGEFEKLGRFVTWSATGVCVQAFADENPQLPGGGGARLGERGGGKDAFSSGGGGGGGGGGEKGQIRACGSSHAPAPPSAAFSAPPLDDDAAFAALVDAPAKGGRGDSVQTSGQNRSFGDFEIQNQIRESERATRRGHTPGRFDGTLADGGAEKAADGGVCREDVYQCPDEKLAGMAMRVCRQTGQWFLNSFLSQSAGLVAAEIRDELVHVLEVGQKGGWAARDKSSGRAVGGPLLWYRFKKVREGKDRVRAKTLAVGDGPGLRVVNGG